MGYAVTDIAVYGVELSSEDARKVYDYLNGKFDGEGYEVGSRLIPESDMIARKSGVGHKYYAEMWSHNTDGRGASLHYQPNFKHSLGIYMGSKGYGYQDRISSVLNRVPKIAPRNFEKYILPILQQCGIEVGEVKPHVVVQVW